jgi:hypothetical protein
MSNINANAVDALYPIAGKDNNSQGFRDNFAAIKDALAIAKTEISDLQAKAVLTGELGVEPLTPAVNDLDTSLIQNGLHKQFYPVFADRGASQTTTTVDASNGPVQKFTAHDGDTFNFLWGNWGSSTTRCPSIRLMFKTTSGTAHINFGGTVNVHTSEVSGTIVPESAVTLPLAINSTNYTVVEAWTTDEGSHVYIHKIGTF